MLRDARYKYVHYTHDRPQLFDLVADPWETDDLASDAAMAPHLDRLQARLRSLVDPEEIDARAKADQRSRIEEFGGSAQLSVRGDDFRYTPAPAEYGPADQRSLIHDAVHPDAIHSDAIHPDTIDSDTIDSETGAS
jgi:hypothetical protein